jgi:hypothetical protein
MPLSGRDPGPQLARPDCGALTTAGELLELSELQPVKTSVRLANTPDTCRNFIVLLMVFIHR